MRTLLLFVLILFPLNLSGQIPFYNDTIAIDEVIIKGTIKTVKPFGYNTADFDSITRSINQHNSLAALLSFKSSVFVKNYGSGGIATTSIRGTGATHSQIAWNNIVINNPMSGQFDLTLIPAGFFDDIRVFYGGSSMDAGGGATGGLINIETKPVFQKNTTITISNTAGSFSTFSGLYNVNAGSEKFQSVTKAFLQSSRNDFTYQDNFSSAERIIRRRENNDYHCKGFLQEIHLRGPRNLFSASFWYQASDRNLPSPVIALQSASGEKQYDESIRSVLNFSSHESKYDVKMTAAVLSDKLNYINRMSSTDSRNNVTTAIIKASAGKNITERFRMDLLISEELNSINSNNYDGHKTRSNLLTQIVANYSVSEFVRGRFLLREYLLDSKLLVPDFSSGIEWMISEKHPVVLGAGISKNSKIPALNDMYWIPGGNSALKNETGYNVELSAGYVGNTDKAFRIKSDLTMFGNMIRNMIQWRPGAYSYWTAENIGRVNTAGIESETCLSFSGKMVYWSLNAGVTFTRAVDKKQNISEMSISPQIPYIPLYQFNINNLLRWKKIYSVVTSHYTGKRFITSDNSQYLPGYLLNDLILGIKLNPGRNELDVNVKVNNISNINYQIIAWYPLPGRSVEARLNFKIHCRK